MTLEELLSNPTLRAALWQAWRDSEPGSVGGHEEGGYLCQSHDNSVSVARRPAGTRKEIYTPPHPGRKRNNETIIAPFMDSDVAGRKFALCTRMNVFTSRTLFSTEDSAS